MAQLKEYFKIKATQQDVYNALTNPFIIQLWSGEPAEMSTEPGSEFSWWGGDICGINVEFKEPELIVQDWYFGEDHLSRVTIKIHADKSGSNIEVRQENIPDADLNDIKDGWKDQIFESLKDLLEE